MWMDDKSHSQLVLKNNNLELYISEMKEKIIYFSKNKPCPQHAEMVNSFKLLTAFKFLGTIISDDLKWEKNTDSIGKEYFLK